MAGGQLHNSLQNLRMLEWLKFQCMYIQNIIDRELEKQIILELIEWRRVGQFRTLVSQISDTAEASLNLHRKLGFVDIGVLRRAGVKFGQEIDVLILQIFFTS